MAENPNRPPDDQIEIFRRLETIFSSKHHLPNDEIEFRLRKLKENINNFEKLHPEVHEYWNEIINDAHPRMTRSPFLREFVEDVDERITEKVDEYYELRNLQIQADSNVVFLLGAGASKASGIPTVNGLLDRLLQQAERTQREDLDPLIEYCNERDDIDIEDLLTAAYLSDFAVTDRHVVRLLHYFLFSDENELVEDTLNADPTSVNFIQETLQTLFGLITSTMIPADPNQTHSAVRRFIDSHENSSIITTNYDYCMDEELLKNNIGLNTKINVGDDDDANDAELLKMHGSINWSYCESCQSLGNIEPETVKESFGADSLDYPVIGVCPDCKGQRRPLLVPPTSFKFIQFPPLIEIWDKAKEELDNADYIITIGYSFSDSDAYIYKLISNTMTDTNGAKMILVNPDEDLTSNLKDQFSRELEGFDPDQRIIGVRENSEDAVPEMVDILTDYGGSAEPESAPEEQAVDDD